MSTYDEISAQFTGFTHFYEFTGGSYNQALELCARLTGQDSQVAQRNGKIIFACRHDLGNEISWLRAVDGQPIDNDPTE